MRTDCEPAQGHRGRPIFRNKAGGDRVDECASPLYDASNCPARISLRTARAMIKWKNIRNRFCHDDSNLQLRSEADTGQARKPLYMKSDEIDQRADSRYPLGRAGGIEAR